ncbi:unnamed protein product [Cunninghamella blakesleeana]
MYFAGLLALSTLAQLVLAAKFNVIAPGAKNVEVFVNGQTVQLKAQDTDVPYFTGEVPAYHGATYKYIKDGEEENFLRHLKGGSTKNDFYNRKVTYADIPKLPTVIGKNDWDKAIAPGDIWDTNYIPSVFVTIDDETKNELVVELSEEIFDAKISIIDAHQVHSFNAAKFQLHKPGKKNNNRKQSWKWELPEGEVLNGRTFFKIRHMEEDPTQIREKLYADLLRSMGASANQANLIRFFINGEFFGTFNMLDDIPHYSYVRANFYNGTLPSNVGPLFDGASGASFENSEENLKAFKPVPGSPDDKSLIEKITQDFEAINPTNDDEVKAFAKEFNLDQFLRYMVMEYLCGHWDGYWQEQTNIGAYEDIENKMVYFIPQDFDATFGVNIAQGKDFSKWPYSKYIETFPKGVLINKLLQNANMKKTFESYLTKTVTKVYNNETLTNHILAYHDFILPDLEDDRAVKQQTEQGIDFGWKASQVTENLWRGVKAPTGENDGGGAEWGLIQWIIEKSEAVAEEFNLNLYNKSADEADAKESGKDDMDDFDDVDSSAEESSGSSSESDESSGSSGSVGSSES